MSGLWGECSLGELPDLILPRWTTMPRWTLRRGARRRGRWEAVFASNRRVSSRIRLNGRRPRIGVTRCRYATFGCRGVGLLPASLLPVCTRPKTAEFPRILSLFAIRVACLLHRSAAVGRRNWDDPAARGMARAHAYDTCALEWSLELRFPAIVL